ncbi:hypothetical protein X560_0124 [Listeria fleischmannii 1991]|uniref:Uncharacterized protein n=1 Tax=Listeria fleischmannii 1991 TaxID=1430899 RepID=A0A0J8GF66_9LIST|nr:hypothetical protein X560_0124 [Listeria fleischmannii 1991]
MFYVNFEFFYKLKRSYLASFHLVQNEEGRGLSIILKMSF